MNDYQEKYGFSESEWENCLKILDVLKDNPFQNLDNQRLAGLITSI